MYMASLMTRAMRIPMAASISSRISSAMQQQNPRNYETLSITTPAPHVTQVELNRPQNLNAMNKVFWREIGKCFNALNEDSSCRAIILSGSGRVFTAGIDLTDMQDMIQVLQSEQDVARKFKIFYKLVRAYQDSFTSLEKCKKPIISIIHSACVGGGVDLISASDIRYCTSDAWFQIKEVDIGMAADVGTLQRLPKIVGNGGLIRELAFSARKMYADEALQHGLVSRVFPDKKSMVDAAVEMCTTIASKSPVAVQGTKVHLNYSRDHTVDESLEYQAQWNGTMLQSEDLVNAAMSQISKTKATFTDL